MRRLERLSVGISAQGIIGWWWLNRSEKVTPQGVWEAQNDVGVLDCLHACDCRTFRDIAYSRAPGGIDDTYRLLGAQEVTTSST
jgi:hypothetical protein